MEAEAGRQITRTGQPVNWALSGGADKQLVLPSSTDDWFSNQDMLSARFLPFCPSTAQQDTVIDVTGDPRYSQPPQQEARQEPTVARKNRQIRHAVLWLEYFIGLVCITLGGYVLLMSVEGNQDLLMVAFALLILGTLVTGLYYAHFYIIKSRYIEAVNSLGVYIRTKKELTKALRILKTSTYKKGEARKLLEEAFNFQDDVVVIKNAGPVFRSPHKPVLHHHDMEEDVDDETEDGLYLDYSREGHESFMHCTIELPQNQNRLYGIH